MFKNKQIKSKIKKPSTKKQTSKKVSLLAKVKTKNLKLKTNIIYAFIDSQNLYKGIKNLLHKKRLAFAIGRNFKLVQSS